MEESKKEGRKRRKKRRKRMGSNCLSSSNRNDSKEPKGSYLSGPRTENRVMGPMRKCSEEELRGQVKALQLELAKSTETASARLQEMEASYRGNMNALHANKAEMVTLNAEIERLRSAAESYVCEKGALEQKIATLEGEVAGGKVQLATAEMNRELAMGKAALEQSQGEQVADACDQALLKAGAEMDQMQRELIQLQTNNAAEKSRLEAQIAELVHALDTEKEVHLNET